MGSRVLLVDDEFHIIRAAEYKLKRAGFDVECALDGQEAWERIQVAPPDVLVSDMQMPRMCGSDLVELVRAHEPTRELPVIMLTAKGFERSYRESLERLNVREVMSKPFSPRELCAKVTDAIAECNPT